MMEYIIQSGDNFYRIAQEQGCSWQDIVQCNPGLDPCKLQVGQKITVPIINVQQPTGYGAVAANGGKYNRCDEVMVEVEGVNFKVSRMGEPSIPHELHLILPRTEVRKVQCPVTGALETSIMISNINIVNSPRFEGERIDKAEGTSKNNSNNNNSNSSNNNNSNDYNTDSDAQDDQYWYGSAPSYNYSQPNYGYNQQNR